MRAGYWAILVAALALAFAASPLLSAGFAGFTRDQFPVVLARWPAQPAGWAFSIWGVIYLWLMAGAGFGLLARAGDAGWQAARPALALSLGVGVFWIPVANLAPVAAVAMILVMAGAAIAALLRAGHGDRWWLAGPLGLYAGWLTAASGVALAVVLPGYGLLGAHVAALLSLGAALVVAWIVQGRRPQDLSYPLAVIWALIGIGLANAVARDWLMVGLSLAGAAGLIWRMTTGRLRSAP